jgi:signal transduction histidine kinase
MRLIQKINRQYISYSFAILIIAGLLLFFILKAIVYEETDENLLNTYKQIELLENESPEELELYPFISVKLNHTNLTGRYFSDTTLPVKNETEKFRQLVVYTTIQGVKYKITVRESGIESDDLLKSLTIIVLLSFAGLLILLFVINKRISKKIWLPFFENLEKLKRFSLQSLLPFIPAESDTDEFNEMNKVLKSLTDKVISDYDNLKKFSENASHELQTPLAIIRSKIEALLNENQLSQSQVDKIQTIYQSVNRLSKINSGLLLLTKIENRQFTEQEQISLNDIIESHAENFTELMEIKEVKFKYNCHSDWIVQGNKVLLEILLNNLFGNAILHNEKGGQIIIDLYDRELKIANTAKSLIPNSNHLFERFYKGTKSDSTGLGLAISKQICLSLGWKITYHFESQLNVFTLTKP